MITEEQKNLLNEQFRLINTDGIAFASLFYSRLFERNPELQTMFRSKMSEQYAKFIGMLSLIIQGMNNPIEIMPIVLEMGESHKRYGVLPYHWYIVQEIFIGVADEKLPEHCNEETRQAWRAAFGFMSEILEA